MECVLIDQICKTVIIKLERSTVAVLKTEAWAQTQSNAVHMQQKKIMSLSDSLFTALLQEMALIGSNGSNW